MVGGTERRLGPYSLFCLYVWTCIFLYGHVLLCMVMHGHIWSVMYCHVWSICIKFYFVYDIQWP